MRQAIIIRPATTPPAMPPFAPEDRPPETSGVGGGAADVVDTNEDCLLEAVSKTRTVGETIVDVREGRYNLGSDGKTGGYTGTNQAPRHSPPGLSTQFLPTIRNDPYQRVSYQ